MANVGLLPTSERATSRATARTVAAPIRRPRSHKALWHNWTAEIALVLTLAGALPLLIAAHFHSLGQPMSDDWSYLTSLSNLAQHGTLNLNHWASIFEVGQLVLVCPLYLVFGVHPVLAELWVWAVGLVGMFATAWLGRRLGAPRPAVLITVAALCTCPLFLRLTTTFMTDVPSYTAIVLALCLWVSCRDHARFEARRWAALGLATLAFTIREPALLVAVPIVGEPLLNAWRQRSAAPSRLRVLAVGAVLWVVAVQALYEWRQGLPGATKSPLHVTPGALSEPWLTGWLPAMFGLFLLPVLLTLSPVARVTAAVRDNRRRALLAVSVTALVPALGVLRLLVVNPSGLQVGNDISLDTAMPVALRLALSLLGLAAGAAATLIALSAFDHRSTIPAHDRRPLKGLLAVAGVSAAVLIAGSAVDLIVWDRYWFPVLALSALVLAKVAHFAPVATTSAARPRRHSTRRVLVPVLALVVVAFYGLAVTVDNDALHQSDYVFATDAAAHLPAGFGPQDLAVSLQWDGMAYAANPTTTFQQVAPLDERYLSHDASGSTFFSKDGVAGSCTPFAITASTGNAPVRGALRLSPVSQGIFVSYRFALVRLPAGHQCTRYW